MDSKDRMKVKDLASQVGKDVELVRSKLTQMGYSTFSAESEISKEACEKIIAMYPKKEQTAKSSSESSSEAPQAGVVRRVVRRDQSQTAAAPAQTQAQEAAPAEAEAPKVVRRKAAPAPEAQAAAPVAKEEPPKAAEEPKTEAPKAEAQKAEEPKAEAPKAEEPKDAKPKAEEPKQEPSKAKEPKTEGAKKIRSAGMASSNETFAIDLGGNATSKAREEFDRARQESANKSRIRRETGSNNAMTRRTERQTQERQAGQNRFQNSRDGGNRDGFKKQGGFDKGGFDKGGFDKDKDSDYSKERRTQSPNKTQEQKAAAGFEHVEPSLETRREKTGDKDSTKKDKRIEGSRNEAGARRSGGSQGAKEGKYNSARQFIGDKMDVSEVESYEFNYNGNFDVNSSRVRKQVNKKKDKEADEARKEAQKLTHVEIPPVITVKEFGELIKKSAADVIKKLFMLGIMATVNAEIDFDTACLVANEFEIEATPAVVVTDEEILLEDPNDEELGEDAVSRPPVVVVMGHVDHGKTSLLDAIRNTSVTTGEAGGITQHIGAYTVTLKDHKITFLDTPGHEAFTAMRARGAQVTDVAIIVVAADDGVMPQTIEAINHAKAANVSIVVAVNKIDKEGANIERVKTEMAEQNVVCEDWGGDVPFIPVSAKKGENIDTLLETVLLSADILDLKASPTKQCKGTVIEAKLDKNKGPVATLLVQRGTLRSGDAILTESTFGHIRTMVNDKGRTIKEAGPSTPVEVTGLPEVPEAGKVFYVVNKDEKLAKKVAEDRMSQMRQTTMTYSNKVTLEGLFSQMQAGEVKDLNIIVKADVKGSAEAIKASLEKLSNDEVRVCVIHNGVGGVSESDVLLAEASNAVIIGFNVRPIGGVGEIAAEKGVDMKLYRIIYDAIDDVKAAMVGMLKPEFKENVIGHVDIRQTFKISGVGTIAGGYVTDGKVVRNSKARIVRDSIVIYEGNLASLKRFKDDVKEVTSGYECGLSFEKFDDLKEGDVIESYVMEEIARTL